MKRKTLLIIVLLITICVLDISFEIPNINGDYEPKYNWSVYQVNSSSDDCYCIINYDFDNSSVNIYVKVLNYDVGAGIRFQNIQLMGNGKIDKAILSIYTENQDIEYEPTYFTIYGIKGNPTTFQNYTDFIDKYDEITNRHINVDAYDDLQGTGWHNISLTNVIEEIVYNKEFIWVNGSLGLMTMADSGLEYVKVKTYDFNTSYAPKLYIREKYTEYKGEFVDEYRGYEIYVKYYLTLVDDEEISIGSYPCQDRTYYSNYSDNFYIFGQKDGIIKYCYKSKWGIWSNWYELDGNMVIGAHFDMWFEKNGRYFWYCYLNTTPTPRTIWASKGEFKSDGIQHISQRENVSDQYWDGYGTHQPWNSISICTNDYGFPFITCERRVVAGTWSNWIFWSFENNGTWVHPDNYTDGYPESSEEIYILNPPNDNNYYQCVVPIGGNNVTLITSMRDGTNIFSVTYCVEFRAKTIGQGEWFSNGQIEQTDHRGLNQLNKWSLSSSNNQAFYIHPTYFVSESKSYLRFLNKTSEGVFGDISIRKTISGDQKLRPYLTSNNLFDTNLVYYIADNNTLYYQYRNINGTWIDEKIFKEFNGTIAGNQLGKHRYAVKDEKGYSIASYTIQVNESGNFKLYHLWLYIELGAKDGHYSIYKDGVLIKTCFDKKEEWEDWLDDYLDKDVDQLPMLGSNIIFWMGMLGLIMMPLSFIMFVLNAQKGDFANAFYLLMVLFIIGMGLVIVWLWG